MGRPPLGDHAMTDAERQRRRRVLKTTESEEREAAHGERMIEIKVRFWTNDIASKGSVIPKHAWAAGVVRIERNETHGIVPGKPEVFHSPLDLGAAIETVLIEHGITLHTPLGMRKYWSDQG